MEKEIVIREAKKEDCREIRNLIQELADFENMPNGPQIDYKVLERDGFDIEHPLFYAYVATVNDKLIGYAIYFYTYSTWQGKAIHLEDIYVTSNYRKKGIGDKLVKIIAKKAIDTECSRINLSVLNWNPAQDFYFKKGATDLTKVEGWHLFRFEREALDKLCLT